MPYLSATLIVFFTVFSNANAACTRAGVAGPWKGTGSVVLTATHQRIPFSFSDHFKLSSQELKGHMVFRTTGGVPIPPLIDQILSETYHVQFMHGDAITFRSNWGRGKGMWGEETYQLNFHDLSGTVHVNESGTIRSCDELTVSGDVFVLGVKVASTVIEYQRP